MRGRYHLLGTFLITTVCCAGCDRGPDLAPVEGRVLLDDKPLTTGHVGTIPTAGRGAHADIGPDGTFSLHTFGSNDGALLGTHKVSVAAYDMSGPRDPESGYGKMLVPQKYANPETSGFVIEVPPEGLENVELKLYTKEPPGTPTGPKSTRWVRSYSELAQQPRPRSWARSYPEFDSP
jgi:hypothetical protein